MSAKNGEKARAHVAKKRRTAQRAKDRAARASAVSASSSDAAKSGDKK